MLTINHKEAGDPQCSHAIDEATEQELFESAKAYYFLQYTVYFIDKYDVICGLCKYGYSNHNLT